MKVFKNWIFVSSILLAITNCSHGKNIDDLGPPVRIKLSNMTNVKLGSGTEPNYLPIIEYTRNFKPLSLSCIIHTRTGEKCEFSFDISEKIVEVALKAVIQLNEKKVIVLWKEFSTGVTFRNVIERVTAIDMSSCKKIDILKFPVGKMGQNNFIYVIPYKNGFDVISSINSTHSRESYNSEGKKISESETFILTDRPKAIIPLSLDSSSKAFFTISRDDLKLKLSLIDKKVKPLVESEAIDVVSHLNHSTYSTCWDDIMQNDTMVVYCRKFDLTGTEKYREQFLTIPNHDWLLDLRNSKDGGLVLFAFSEEQETLRVSAITSNHKVETLSYEVRSVPGNRKIVDFDEGSGTFVFAYEAAGDVEGKVVLQKYYLPRVHD